MKNIEPAKDFIYVCDYKGYFNGRTYYIHKATGGYVASLGFRNSEQFKARTLKQLSDQLSKVTA